MTHTAEDNGCTSRATDIGREPDFARRGADGKMPRPFEELPKITAGGVTMSDAFPMPKTVEMPPATRGDYAPKRGLAAVAEAVASPHEAAVRDSQKRYADALAADPPPSTLGQGGGAGYKAPRHADAIRESLKKLTHREMRELTAEIFKAANGDTIAKLDLPDVLDKFAYGD